MERRPRRPSVTPTRETWRRSAGVRPWPSSDGSSSRGSWPGCSGCASTSVSWLGFGIVTSCWCSGFGTTSRIEAAPSSSRAPRTPKISWSNRACAPSRSPLGFLLERLGKREGAQPFSITERTAMTLEIGYDVSSGTNGSAATLRVQSVEDILRGRGQGGFLGTVTAEEVKIRDLGRCLLPSPIAKHLGDAALHFVGEADKVLVNDCRSYLEAANQRPSELPAFEL